MCIRDMCFVVLLLLGNDRTHVNIFLPVIIMANIRVQLNAVGMPAIASVRDRIAVRVNYTTVPKTNVNPVSYTHLSWPMATGSRLLFASVAGKWPIPTSESVCWKNSQPTAPRWRPWTRSPSLSLIHISSPWPWEYCPQKRTRWR